MHEIKISHSVASFPARSEIPWECEKRLKRLDKLFLSLSCHVSGGVGVERVRRG